MGEYTHAHMSRVLFLSCVLLLEAQQEQTSKLRTVGVKKSSPFDPYNGRPFKKNGRRTEIER